MIIYDTLVVIIKYNNYIDDNNNYSHRSNTDNDNDNNSDSDNGLYRCLRITVSIVAVSTISKKFYLSIMREKEFLFSSFICTDT